MTYWPEDPYGDMVPILRESVEAAKRRHPSGRGSAVDTIDDTPPLDVLSLSDRCDACGVAVAAQYRLSLPHAHAHSRVLDLCGHHYVKHSTLMFAHGWVVTGLA